MSHPIDPLFNQAISAPEMAHDTASNQDWHVDNEGHCQPVSLNLPGNLPGNLPDPCPSPLRLYRFLTYLEDIVQSTPDDGQRLSHIRPLVRQFLDQSPLLLMQCPEPDPERGWAVLKLYDDTDFPLTIQLVSWLPGSRSPIHNHAAWGLVAILEGQERNLFWRRSPLPTSPEPEEVNPGIQQHAEQCLTPGDLITFMPDAIHQIEALGSEPVVSFNLYGETDYSRRFQFDERSGRAQAF